MFPPHLWTSSLDTPFFHSTSIYISNFNIFCNYSNPAIAKISFLLQITKFKNISRLSNLYYVHYFFVDNVDNFVNNTILKESKRYLSTETFMPHCILSSTIRQFLCEYCTIDIKSWYVYQQILSANGTESFSYLFYKTSS